MSEEIETAQHPWDMTEAEPAPLPWDWVWQHTIVGNASGGGHIYLTDRTGRKIGVIYGKADEKVATAQLIVSRVNALLEVSDLDE